MTDEHGTAGTTSLGCALCCVVWSRPTPLQKHALQSGRGLLLSRAAGRSKAIEIMGGSWSADET